MQIGEQLRRRRESLGLSQAAVAREAKITAFGLRKVEMSGSDPKHSTLERLGAALRWRLGWTETNGEGA